MQRHTRRQITFGDARDHFAGFKQGIRYSARDALRQPAAKSGAEDGNHYAAGNKPAALAVNLPQRQFGDDMREHFRCDIRRAGGVAGKPIDRQTAAHHRLHEQQPLRLQVQAFEARQLLRPARPGQIAAARHDNAVCIDDCGAAHGRIAPQRRIGQG